MLVTVLSWMTIAVSAIAAVHASVFLLLNWENLRHWKRRQVTSVPNPNYFPRALLIIPCKGLERGLRENLTAFMQQDHPNYEVTFTVESWKDPCVPLLREIIQENSGLDSRIKVSGQATTSGQKVHNLRAATEKLHQEIEILAFADSDALPKSSSWLRWIVCDLGKTGLGARTGYRWFVPQKNNFATFAVCSINNSIASLMGRGTHLSVWGGSWAIHRRVFDSVSLHDAWNGVLSDDMVATRTLRAAKLGVKFEPNCVCRSDVKFSTQKMFEFLRRQFLIGRLHDPQYWWTAFGLLLIKQAAIWGCLAMAVLAIDWPTQMNLWLATAGLIYMIGIARGVIRRKLGKLPVLGWQKKSGFILFDIFAGPFVGLVTLLAMISSLVGSTISWRGIHYGLGQGGRTMLIGRDVTPEVWQAIDSRLKTDEPPMGAFLKLYEPDAAAETPEQPLKKAA